MLEVFLHNEVSFCKFYLGALQNAGNRACTDAEWSAYNVSNFFFTFQFQKRKICVVQIFISCWV